MTIEAIDEYIVPTMDAYCEEALERVSRLEEQLLEKTKNYYGLKRRVEQLEHGIGELAERIEGAVRKGLGAQEGDWVQRGRATIRRSVKEGYAWYQNEVEKVLKTTKSYLSEFRRDLTLQERWVKLGLPEEAFEIEPDCVGTLLSSGAAYAMVCFSKKDPSRLGIEVRDGQVAVCVEGKMMPWKEFDTTYEWCKKARHFIQRDDASVRLSYVAFPRGFIKADQCNYTEPFPVQELSYDEFCALKEQAALFDGRGVDTFDGVFQLYTSPGTFRLPKMMSSLQKSVDDVSESLPTHYAYRIITPDRKVYSMGLLVETSDWKNFRFLRLGKTMDGYTKMIDSDECKAFPNGRVVTSVPATKEQLESIFDSIRRASREGEPFNFGDENCTTAAIKKLRLLGIEVNVKTDFTGLFSIASTFIGACAREIARRKIQPVMSKPIMAPIRLCGRGVSACAKAVHKVASCLIGGLYRIVPRPIRSGVTLVTGVVTRPLIWTSSLLKVTTAWTLGAGEMSLAARKKGLDNPNFKPFLSHLSWKALFSPVTTYIDASMPLLRWQKQQRSTKTYQYHGLPEFTVV